MSPGSRHRQEDTVIARVVPEAADLGQPEPIPIERDDLIQTLGVPSHPQLHRSALSCGHRHLPFIDDQTHSSSPPAGNSRREEPLVSLARLPSVTPAASVPRSVASLDGGNDPCGRPSGSARWRRTNRCPLTASPAPERAGSGGSRPYCWCCPRPAHEGRAARSGAWCFGARVLRHRRPRPYAPIPVVRYPFAPSPTGDRSADIERVLWLVGGSRYVRLDASCQKTELSACLRLVSVSFSNTRSGSLSIAARFSSAGGPRSRSPRAGRAGRAPAGRRQRVGIRRWATAGARLPAHRSLRRAADRPPPALLRGDGRLPAEGPRRSRTVILQRRQDREGTHSTSCEGRSRRERQLTGRLDARRCWLGLLPMKT
jgi:hypothetical protein